MKRYYAKAQRRYDQLDIKLDNTLEDRVVRVGSFWTVFRWKNVPALCLIPFNLGVLYLLLEAEIICGMVYVSAGFPELVKTSFSSLPWLTPAKIAFSLVVGYVFGMYALLKHLPRGLGAVALSRFRDRVRWVMTALHFVAPIVFAWVVGVAKETANSGMYSLMSEPTWSPGMPTYIGVGIFLLAYSTYSISMALRDAVESLYDHETVVIPERALASDEFDIVTAALASYDDVIDQANTVLEAAASATQKLARENQFAHQCEHADIQARESQAFLLPSRN